MIKGAMQAGAVINSRYQLSRCVGAGAMGEVLAPTPLRAGTPCARAITERKEKDMKVKTTIKAGLVETDPLDELRKLPDELKTAEPEAGGSIRA